MPTKPVALEKQPTLMKNVARADVISDEEGWMQRVHQTDGSGKERKLLSWHLLKDRLTFRAKEARPPVAKDSPAISGSIVTDTQRRNDAFLQRVERKEAREIVGTAEDANEPDTLEDFATGKDAGRSERKTSISRREVADERKDPTESPDENPVPKITSPAAQEPPPPVRKKVQMHARASRLHTLIATISHIGMGKERMHFVENMAMMLNAGLPLIDSLRTLQLETRGKPMRMLLQRMLDSVENGSPLWRAMEDQQFFSLQALALVRIGEEAGNLAENIAYLAQQEEKDHALRGKVKMAMIYPTIVLTLMFIIVIGLGMFVLPNLIGVLYSLNVELPFVTRLIILFTEAFTTYGATAVPAFIAGCIVFMMLAKFTKLKILTQWAMFRIPGIGRLAREATIARFGVILGGLLKAGVPVIEAMQSLVEVTPILAYRRLYQRMLEHITVGDSFGKSFSAIKGSSKLLPPSVQQLVITGEKSGSLSEIMLKIADIYDRKASETAQKLPVILEPMLLLFIGGLVGTIAFAIIVPIYSIVGSVGR